VLRLLDTRGGEEAAAVRPAHPGELRLLVSARDRTGLGTVRVHLLADLIRRVAERRGLLVTVCDLAEAGGDLVSLRDACAALNIHPPQHTMPPFLPAEELEARLSALFPGGAGPAGGPGHAGAPLFDVLVASVHGPGREDVAGWARLAAYCGHVTPAEGAEGTAASPRDVTERGLDPLALRLALLRIRYREPASLGWEMLHAAGKTLLRWREEVAAWARSPSRPMSRRYFDAVIAAFDDNLDAHAALRQISALEGDAGEADGTKFETFAAADRLLGLDLARDVGSAGPGGRPPGTPRLPAAVLAVASHGRRAVGPHGPRDRGVNRYRGFTPRHPP